MYLKGRVKEGGKGELVGWFVPGLEVENWDSKHPLHKVPVS